MSQLSENHPEFVLGLTGTYLKIQSKLTHFIKQIF